MFFTGQDCTSIGLDLHGLPLSGEDCHIESKFARNDGNFVSIATVWYLTQVNKSIATTHREPRYHFRAFLTHTFLHLEVNGRFSTVTTGRDTCDDAINQDFKILEKVLKLILKILKCY